MNRWEWSGHPASGVMCYVVLTSLHIVEAYWADGKWQRVGGGKRADKIIKDEDIIEWRRI